MKNIKYILSFFVATMLLGCADDENGIPNLDGIGAPTNITALFTITQDNSGKVTIRPNGEGVTSYEVHFGDATPEPGIIAPGEAITHVYAEGVYMVKIHAIGINGLMTEFSQELTVTFVAPADLNLVVTPQVGNPYLINVTATALYETFFEVTFGEDPDQIPVQFNEGTTVTHTYSSVGTYEVKVIAYSGGVATSEATQMVTVFDPLLLPLNFESATLNYAFGDFGGVFTGVSANPSVSGENTSAKVGKITKTAGAETWAGTSIALDQPIDFSTLQTISIKTFSPIAGAVVKLKLENLNNGNINVEVDAVTTVANQWETLSYSFAGIDNANNYQRIVIFYDFGNVGTGAEFHFDEIMQTSGAPVVSLPLNFQSTQLTYAFTNFGGCNAGVIDNPNPSGINTSSKVAQLTKNSGSEVWAGAFIQLGQPIDFSSLNTIKMKVWSPQAGIVVKLKLENLTNSTIATELDAVTTVANGWEELTYTFTGVVNANNYQTVVVFFDFGNSGTGATYYFDDIQLSN